MHATIVAVQDKAQSYIEQAPWNDFIPLAIETYNCFHLHFDPFLISCVHASIVRHQQTSLVLSMLISYYKQWVLIALQHVQAITILQHVTTFNHSSSYLPHIPTNAPPSLVDLWQRMPFSITSSISLLLYYWSWFSFRVFTFASTCLVLFVDGFPSLFLYIYMTSF